MLPSCFLISSRTSRVLNRSLRLWSLYSLGRIGRTAALEQEKVHQLLLQMLLDEDSSLRTAALWGVSQMLRPGVIGTLLEVLSNDADFL